MQCQDHRILAACPVQGDHETLAAYPQRVQAFTDAVETAKALQEAAEAEHQRLAHEAAAQAQRTAEADATARDKRNAASAESLIQNESQWTALLQAMTFVPTDKQADPTPEEAERSNLANLMLCIMRAVMWNNTMQTVHAHTGRQMRQTQQRESSTLTAAIRAAAQHQQQQQQQQQLLASTITRVNSIEAKPTAAPGCTMDMTKQLGERIDYVINIIGDLSDFTSAATISRTVAAIKTDITKLQSRPEAAAKTFKMPRFNIAKFDGYNKMDALAWWQDFVTEAACHHVPDNQMMTALYLQLIGGAQTFMNHTTANLGTTIANLHMHITWEQLEQMWYTRFMVRNVVKAAMNDVYSSSQGNMSTQDWMIKGQKIFPRQLEREKKKKNENKKARKEAERLEEMNKNLDIKVAVRIGELREDVREDLKNEIREAISKLSGAVARGNSKEAPATGSESSASSSETEDLSNRTCELCISKKRKQGPEPVFQDSPPMELPPKRTPRRLMRPAKLTARFTRSQMRVKNKTPMPKKTPPTIRKKNPASIGIIGRLKYEKQVLNDLKNLDALVLQNICKEEGIAYNDKFKFIFDIAAHRTRVAYDTDGESEEESSQSGDTVAVAVDGGKQETE
ncbi:hypothetical protein CBR_g51428 [Chara braunii]|uniref:Uncharacterized protein n=1 Tax=Chara braunii TaxID=69332 RepID=A0A388K667_CHABU|nr:hypothetical protein CBR_g51428 [Chara braunii]|eukprot:GBG65545.1 hypothetical protein CBR_g51428 [Chara braunii]